uniref:Uncharacterized protein n=1 Tax=Desulfovibrio sp. U5L TaxID=596152 RepID=I2Q4Q2_9BACT
MEYDRVAQPSENFAASVSSSSGFSLLYTIFSIVVLSSLAAAIASLAPNTAMTNLTGESEKRAYYLALSGLNFWSKGKSGLYRLGEDAFSLDQSGPDAAGDYTVTSVGTVAAGTGRETNVRLTAKRPSAAIITFEADLASFTQPVLGRTENNANAVVVFGVDSPEAPASFTLADWTALWSANVYRYASGWIRLGGGIAQTSGAIWYEGNKGSCDSGRCAFGKGLRTYFQFVFSGYDTSLESTDYGDGFTFTVMTADNDPRYAAGGTADGLRGEYLGYAGPGPSGRGIVPPKMAVEVDVYPNCYDGDPMENNSRRDKSNANHVAAVYWGEPDTSYDDNVHGVGAGPANPTGGGDGYYEQASPAGPAWLEDGLEHAMRVEIIRETDDTQGVYTIRAWVDPAYPGMDDVSEDYTAEAPLVRHTVRLAAADHARLDTVCFGWTEATGGHGQSVAIHDFALAFRR